MLSQFGRLHQHGSVEGFRRSVKFNSVRQKVLPAVRKEKRKTKSGRKLGIYH